MKSDIEKLKTFHEELTGIHMINWELQTNGTKERIGQIIPNVLSMQILNMPITFVYIQKRIALSDLHVSFNTVFKTECYTFPYNTHVQFCLPVSKEINLRRKGCKNNYRNSENILCKETVTLLFVWPNNRKAERGFGCIL